MRAHKVESRLDCTVRECLLGAVETIATTLHERRLCAMKRAMEKCKRQNEMVTVARELGKEDHEV